MILPLTASISYAASETAQEVPEPPAPPAPPSPPEAPLPPEPPLPPEAPTPPKGAGNVEVIERVFTGEDGKEKRVRMVVRSGPDGAATDGNMAELEGLDPADREEMLAGLREGMAEADRALADLPRILSEAQAAADGARPAIQNRVIVRHECKPGSKEVSESTTSNGTQVVSICQSRVYASARKGLEEARAEIAADKDITEETRKQILKELDRTIARWGEKEG
jgi:hypothetical protein